MSFRANDDVRILIVSQKRGHLLDAATDLAIEQNLTIGGNIPAQKDVAVSHPHGKGQAVDEVEVKSVKKKLKDKAFARAVSREDIRNGAEELGIPLDEHIEFCILAMRENKEALGL